MGSAMASSVVGNWTGKIHSPMPPARPGETPQQAQMRAKVMQAIANAKISLNLKANKTFTLGASVPGKAGQSQPGTWSQSGNTITLNMKTPQGPQTEKATLSANGKTLTLIPSKQGGGRATITFSRA